MLCEISALFLLAILEQQTNWSVLEQKTVWGILLGVVTTKLGAQLR
jgi:hypothetical protein